MKTANQRILRRGVGLALLLATGLSLSSCIIVEPRHRRHYRRPYLGATYTQGAFSSHEVRP